MSDPHARIALLEAENARLREALVEIENSPSPDHWVPQYQHCVDVAATTLAASAPASDGLRRVKHLKRGSTYSVIGEGQVQTDTPFSDYDAVTVYRGTDGKIWVRPTAEFEDGRFVELAPASDTTAGAVQEAARVLLRELFPRERNYGPNASLHAVLRVLAGETE